MARKSAAWITSSNSLAGATGGVCLMRLTDRLGVGSLTMFACAAVPLLLLAAFAPVSPRAFIALIVLNSLFMSGAHYGIQSISGIFYPTPCRALGTGWASSVAKIGSVLGPWLGGILLTTHIPLRHAFAVIAVCPAAVCLSMLALARLQRQLRAAPALQSERVRI